MNATQNNDQNRQNRDPQNKKSQDPQDKRSQDLRQEIPDRSSQSSVQRPEMDRQSDRS